MFLISAQVKGKIYMNSKIIASTCILSLAIILGACGPINETYDTVEFTESTTAATTASTTTALTSSLTAVTSNVSTVTTLNTTTALTSVTGGSTAISTVTAETEAEKQQDNPQVNTQDNMQDKAETTTVHNDTTEYNDSKSSTSATAVTTMTTETKTTDVTTTAVTENTTIAAETTAVTTVTTENNEPYLVYKPSTKYAHRSTCRWNKDDAYRCDDFSELETRICSECKPDVGDHIEYQTPTVGNKDNATYVGNFHMTYYPETAYYPGVCGGSARTLRGYGDYSDGIRGSVACRTIQEAYGYDRNGRTTVYLEFPSYPCMNGNYWVDDCCGAYGTIDVFVWSDAACPFEYDGVTRADCWIY